MIHHPLGWSDTKGNAEIMDLRVTLNLKKNFKDIFVCGHTAPLISHTNDIVIADTIAII